MHFQIKSNLADSIAKHLSSSFRCKAKNQTEKKRERENAREQEIEQRHRKKTNEFNRKTQYRQTLAVLAHMFFCFHVKSRDSTPGIYRYVQQSCPRKRRHVRVASGHTTRAAVQQRSRHGRTMLVSKLLKDAFTNAKEFLSGCSFLHMRHQHIADILVPSMRASHNHDPLLLEVPNVALLRIILNFALAILPSVEGGILESSHLRRHRSIL